MVVPLSSGTTRDVAVSGTTARLGVRLRLECTLRWFVCNGCGVTAGVLRPDAGDPVAQERRLARHQRRRQEETEEDQVQHIVGPHHPPGGCSSLVPQSRPPAVCDASVRV